MSLRFYAYFIWVLVLCALSYLERWLHYGGYSWTWMLLMGGAVFFLGLCKHQIEVDRAETRAKKDDNPFR